MKKLSIVIPVYNEEKNLKKLFIKLSLLRLKRAKKEIIVINDNW